MSTSKPPESELSSIEKMVNSVGLTLGSRIAVLIGTPAMLGLLGWLLVTTVDNNKQLAALNATVIMGLQTQTARSDYVEREMDKADHYIDTMLADHELRIRQIETDQPPHRRR